MADALGAEVLNRDRGHGRGRGGGDDRGDDPGDGDDVHAARVAGKAIITGGDRADIQMAALSTDTSCLVLTGGLYPPKPVIAKAYEVGVPILVTRHNTMEAAEMVEHLIARIDPDDAGKIDRIAQVVKQHVDLDAVWADSQIAIFTTKGLLI